MLGKRKNAEEKTPIKKKIKTVDFESLHPLEFFITNPPVVYFSNYSRLTTYVLAIINGELDFEKDKFTLNELPIQILQDLGVEEEATRGWKAILDYLEEYKFQELFEKLTIVDKILCLLENQSEEIVNAQKELWWVKQSKYFFQQSPFARGNYIKIAFSALMLECFYRFVWAHFTFSIYAKSMKHAGEKKEMAEPDSMETSTNLSQQEEIISAEDMGNYSSDNENDSPLNSPTAKDAAESEEEAEEISAKEAAPLIASDREISLPNVVDLFFNHVSISKAINAVEADYFDKSIENFMKGKKTFNWNIEKVIKIFIQLAIKQQNEKASKTQATETLMSEHEIQTKIIAKYVKKFVPFLRKLGVYVNPECPYVSNISFSLAATLFPILESGWNESRLI